MTPSLGKLRQNGGLQRLWAGNRRPTALHGAICADQKLLKVPPDPLQAKRTGLLGLEPLEQRAGVLAVDIHLGHDGEGDAVIDLAKLLDVIVGAGLLVAELVAGEAEDDKFVGVLGIDRLPERLKLLVLRSKAALGGRVDDQDDLALVVAQGNLDVPFCGWLEWAAPWKRTAWMRLRTVEGLEVVEACR